MSGGLIFELALFLDLPVLPYPVLPSVCVYDECEVDVGGRGQYSNIYLLNLKVIFLLVKTSSFHHTEV